MSNVQVLDRVVFHQGSANSWRSAMLRARAQSMTRVSNWKAGPAKLFALTLRARAAPPPSGKTMSIPAARSPLSFNACMDIDSLSLRNTDADASASGNSSGNGKQGLLHQLKLQRLPASSAALRRDLDGGRLLHVAAHVNRPFGTMQGWQKVCQS